jgi:transposase-like protein
MQPASDVEPAVIKWRSTRPHQAEAVRLYQAGRSLTSISKEIGIAWESVARLLDQAGVREWKNKPR